MSLYDYTYRNGSVPFRACRLDTRFSYALYVPNIQDWSDSPIIITVHGTDRTAERYRDLAIALCKKHKAIVLSPLFPAGIGTPNDLDDYKILIGHGIRYDLILLEMVKEVVEHYHCQSDLYLWGFSGGGQFVHRFTMLYPDMVKAVSIGAPGLVTLPRPDLPWWAGYANVKELFAREIDWEKLKQVKVQMLVGEHDVDRGEIKIDHKDVLWVEGSDIANGTRIERLSMLRDAWVNLGIQVEWKLVPHAEHEGEKLWSYAEEFLERKLG